MGVLDIRRSAYLCRGQSVQPYYPPIADRICSRCTFDSLPDARKPLIPAFHQSRRFECFRLRVFSASAHLGKGRMARSIDERQGSAARFDIVGADVLGDAAGFKSTSSNCAAFWLAAKRASYYC